MVGSVASILKSNQVPVAYAFGPFTWRSTPERDLMPADEIEVTKWVRIGYGLPGNWTNDFIVALAVSDVAAANNWHFGIYSPDRNPEATKMGTRFALDQAAPSAVQPTAIAPQQRFHASNTFDARVGLVADLISKISPDDAQLASISMAALHGRTIISVVGSQAVARSIGGHSEIPHLDDRQDQMSFWMSWRCGDHPGVALKLLNSLRSFQRDDIDLSSVSVEYAVSRAFDSGLTCAGKIRLLGPRKLVESIVSGDAHSALIATMSEAVAERLQAWSPPERYSWKKDPIRLSLEEPGEEPWATLALTVGSTVAQE